MRTIARPNLVISACLGFEKCRYNGEILKDQFIEKLKDYVNFIPVCPETAIGLGIPRDTIRIIVENDEVKLLQPKLERDITVEMLSFNRNFVNSLDAVEGFIVKGKSPSCGYKDAKYYSSKAKSASSTKGNGLFTQELLNRFVDYPLIDDGRLNDFKYREHFLIKLFMLTELHEIIKQNSLDSLRDFHNTNRLLLMCYSQKGYKELDKRLKNSDFQSVESLISAYIENVLTMTSKIARYTSNIKMILYTLSLLETHLKASEKDNILDAVQQYEKGHLPFCVPLYLLKAAAVQWDKTEILNQTIFSPFPEELMELRDSGKVRI